MFSFSNIFAEFYDEELNPNKLSDIFEQICQLNKGKSSPSPDFFLYEQKIPTNHENETYSDDETSNNKISQKKAKKFIKKKNFSNPINTKKNTLCYTNTLDDIPFDCVESSFNFQGNYQNYISRVIRSLPPLFNLDFSNFIQEGLVLLPEYNKKKTLILDMDETLIHADFDGKFDHHDKTIRFTYENQEVSVEIFLRPGVLEFLQKVCEIFEIFIFTASKKEYADAVLDYLDPEKKIIKHRLYRNSCIPINNKTYIKDLSIFVNRKPENIILVDNSFYSFYRQPSNGVLINSFYNDPDDNELKNLFNYLQNYLLPVKDIREVNEQIFSFQSLLNKCTKV